MKVLFLDAYFHPERIAYTALEDDIISELREIADIDLICPVPTRGVSRETAKKYRGIKKEILPNGVDVTRFWAPQEGKNPVIRAFRYFLCGIRHYAHGVKAKNVDAVFAVSTPPTQGAVAALVAKRLSKKQGKHVPFIYGLQDIFPDSLVTAGLTRKGSLLWKLGRRLENYTYRNADRIIVISEGFKRNIMAKGVPAEKIEVVSNWIDAEAVRPVPRSKNKLFYEFGIPKDKFTVVYAGNFGASQGTRVILGAAERLAEREDIHFAVFGGGAEFDDFRKAVSEKGLDNITVNGLLPVERVSEVYSLGNAALITCKKGVGGNSMPSKTWSIMACGTPIIAAFDTDSELAEIISKADAGICIEPENIDALADAIEAMASGEGHFDGGRDFVCENASRPKCVGKYVSAICGGDNC